ncbi:hypothetical protein BJV78DRAFT_1279662 [Lactifluus subvellereus]|nr:hypothetical protein BJV78DRAFT_1279662 [Lactifluus subvellereus]
MSKSADLIQSNSQIFRVYSRRLSNPGDADIFIASAGKLTAFLSNTRAYYTEAQQPIIDLLEVACNSLKNVAPDVFSTPGSIDRSVIPDGRVPLFDAFVKLANSVTPYIHLFTDESLNNRLRSFLSSIGVALPSAAINVTSPDTSIQTSTLSSIGHQADSTTPQATSSIGAAPSDSQVLVSRLSPSTKETARSKTVIPEPTSAPLVPVSSASVAESSSVSTPVQVPTVVLSKVNTSDGGDVVRSIPNQQTVPLPPRDPLHQPPLPQAPVSREVVDPVPEKPNPHDQISRPPLPSLLPMSSIPLSLHTKLLSPISVSGTISPSQKSQPAPSVTHVVMPQCTSNVMSQDRVPQTVLESSVSSPQVSQSVPLSQVQVPMQTPATPLGDSSEQQKPMPTSRRQSLGLDFLQLDLQAAREKKQRAAAQAAEAQRSASPAQVSAAHVSSPVPSISKKVSPSPATATPTSTTPVDMPNTPSAQTFPHAVPAVAQAPPAHVLTHSLIEPVHPPANVSSESKVLSATSQPPNAQTPSPSLVHRDLRQGSTRNGSSVVSPRKLWITNRAPAPAPEPGSESAPIVIDEDEGEEPAPTDQRTEAQAPTPTLLKTEELSTPAPDSQDVRGSKVEDSKPEPEPEGQAIREQVPQENVSVPEFPSRLPVSGPELSTTSTLRVNVPAQKFSALSTPSLLSSVSTPAVPSPRPLAPAAPSCDKLQGALPQQATDGKEIQNGNGDKGSMDTDTGTTSVVAEQGKTAEDLVEGQVRSSVDIVSAATVEPPLGSESSAPRMGSTQPPALVMASSKSKDTKMTAPAPPVVASVTSVTRSSPALVATPATSPAIPAGAESTKSGPMPSVDVQVHALHQAVGELSPPSSLTELGPTPISREHIPVVSVAETSPTSGKHQRSPTPNGQTRRVMVREESPGPISEGQRDLPLHSDTVKSTSFDTIILDTRPGENEGRPETALGTSFSPKPSVSHGLATPSGNASGSTLPVPTMVSHKRIGSFSDMDISRSSMSPPPIAVLGTRTRGSSVTNHSSGSRSTSPPSGRRPSEGGTEVADDEMVDELAPLFGKEMRVLCMDRAYDVPGEFTWDFTLPDADWDRVSQWTKAPENPGLDISQARCITLACYSTQDLEPYASQAVMTREQWFENTKPVPWAKLPRSLWALINDEVAVVFPPYMSPDDLFDVSPFLRPGLNKISFTQIDGMAEYVLVLHGHYPTRGQLEPLHERWEQEKYFQEQLAWLSRPFSIEW